VSGLRKADGEGGARDTRPTTNDERVANYFSVVGLEPEDITISRVTEGEYTDFLLLKKPLYTWPGLFIVALGIPVYFIWSKVGVPSAADEDDVFD